MANEQNLRPSEYKLSQEEAKKGGKRSGEVRRQRRTFAELFNSYLDKPIQDEQLKAKMRQMGFEDDELINKNVVVFAQYREAMKGNTQSAVFIRDTTGEKPIEQVQNINPPVIKLEKPNE